MSDRSFRDACLRGLRADHERGASQLARLALGHLAEAARDDSIADVETLRSELDRFARDLESARPSMVPIENLVRRWRQEVDALPPGELAEMRAACVACARELAGRSQRAASEAARRAAKLLPSAATVLTHSLSSTVLEVLDRSSNEVTVIFTESRPRLEGHRFGRWLSAAETSGELITDAQIGLFTARADVVLVGADAVLADGSVVNKVGTYPLALAARDRGVPFYVCCESFKRTSRAAAEITLEEMDPAELAAPELPGIVVRNVYFDLTPGRLISAWVDENGVHRP